MARLMTVASRTIFSIRSTPPICTCQFSSTTAIFSSPRVFSSSSATRKGKQKQEPQQEELRWKGWQPVIGLELHVQLKGNPKLFSSASAIYDAEPNTHVQPFDAALPGSLPILSTESVRLALLACLALNSSINPASTFDRKHYFYPDLPAGFQVTQKYSPLAKDGVVEMRSDPTVGVTRNLKVRIEQIQLEQDTAKSFHDPSENLTLVDLNRAGAALIEIVTKPDMRSPEEAALFVRSLQSILRHVGASDANMDRGELRCDVNVSIRKEGEPNGTRCEIKNLNGVRFLIGAIESEISRQIESIESGVPIVQSTMGYDAVENKTFVLRSKEDAPDYRYMPDPELGPILITPTVLEELKSTLPELPEKAYQRLQKQYHLTPRDAGILVAVGESLAVDDSIKGGLPDWLTGGSDTEVEGGVVGIDEGVRIGTASIGVRYFETLAFGREAKVCANWIINDLLSALGSTTSPPLNLLTSPIGPHELGTLIDALSNQKITSTNAKSLLKQFIISNQEPIKMNSNPIQSSTWSHCLRTAVELHSKTTTNSTLGSLQDLCHQVIDFLPEESEKYKRGHKKVLMRLVGEVMKRSQGMADAQEAKRILEGLLKV